MTETSQPFAAFPLPFGMMLCGDDGGAECGAALAALHSGRLPGDWPSSLEAHRLALAGDLEGALGAIGDDDPYADYNRYVLDPVGRDPGRAASGLPAQQRALVEVVRFSAGERDDAPELPADAAPVAGALVLAAQASLAAADGEVGRQVQLLEAAAERVDGVAPAFAAILRGEAGGALAEHGVEAARAEELLVEASAGLAATDLRLSRAEIEHRLGALAHADHDRVGALQQSMRHYNIVLGLISREDAPYLWAQTQMNLSAAYLAAQMAGASDGLRVGIAVQALRAALEVFQQDRYPVEWAAATVDLANALVYAPSAKQGDNLVEAVELYEQVLAVRGGDVDPVGRARVLANQGNALAHLGIFDHAVAKLSEARTLFAQALEPDAALTVSGLLDQIAKQRQELGVKEEGVNDGD